MAAPSLNPIPPSSSLSSLGSGPGKSKGDLKFGDFSNLYVMYYRHGMNANLTKGFYCSGDIAVAIQKARDHCKIMGYRYIFVRPLIVDIEAEESYKLRGLQDPLSGEF